MQNFDGTDEFLAAPKAFQSPYIKICLCVPCFVRVHHTSQGNIKGTISDRKFQTSLFSEPPDFFA